MSLAVVITLTSLFLERSVHSTYNEKPNFVILFADDLGFNDVDWRGTTNIFTPNLRALRNNAALELNRFYVAPKCSPTRSSLMTGRYTYKIGMQHDVGIIEFFTCGLQPSIGTTFWTTRLKTCSGYNNYYMGKWHLGEYYWSTTPIFRGGFDYFKGYLNSQVNYFNFTYHPNIEIHEIPNKTYHGGFYDWRENTDILFDTNDNYTTTAFGESALNIIKNIGDTNDDTPFSLIVSFEAPHGPVHYPPGFFWDDIVPGNGKSGPGGPYGDPNNEYYEERRQYVSMVYAMDYYIGEIIDALKANTVNNVRIWDNTLFFFFSDNGGVITFASNYPLRGAKSTNFEGGIRVPALISGGLLPNRFKGQSYDGIVHITDLYATIMDLSGTGSSDLFLDGESLRSLLESPTNDLTHTRSSFIITADEVNCSAIYNGERLCGGVIRDFGTDGLWKLVIGTEALDGSGKKFGWGELPNQQGILNYQQGLGISAQFNCDPENKNYSIPEYGNAFKATDCASNQLPCLYKIDEDPCETDNKAEDPTYSNILSTLVNELQQAYDDQARPFWTNEDCMGAAPEQVFDFQYANGYWQPFAPHIEGNDYNKSNTEIFTGTCTPTPEPTSEPTKDPTSSFCCSNIAWQNKWANKCPNFGTKNACERLKGPQGNNRCKWMNCALIGQCKYITGSNGGSQKICKKLTHQDDCEAKAFCEWEFTNTLANNIQFVNDYDNVHNINVHTTKIQPLQWAYLLFILLSIVGLIYFIWKRFNVYLKKVNKEKYVGTEYETLLLKV